MENKESAEGLQFVTLLEPLASPLLRHQFLNKLYCAHIMFEEFQNTDSGFHAFYDRFETLRHTAANSERLLCNCTYWQLLEIIDIIRTPSQSREQVNGIARQLSRGHTIPTFVMINFGASLLSLVIVGEPFHDVSYEEPVMWEPHMILGRPSGPDQVTLLENLFPNPSNAESVKLPQTFTAANLEKIGGIQIRWTNNLADHLLLRDDDTKLMLFHHVSVLKLQRYADSILPKGLAEETVRTMSLLIPPMLGEANPWFRQEQEKYHLDASAGICDRLNSSERQIDKFHFWRQRLVLLKRTFDEKEPRTLSQLWWDDRRKTQWFTFWVAVLVFITTIFFGVLQSVASIVQAWASVKALEAHG